MGDGFAVLLGFEIVRAEQHMGFASKGWVPGGIFEGYDRVVELPCPDQSQPQIQLNLLVSRIQAGRAPKLRYRRSKIAAC
jgi:hypothetical protein